LPALAILAKIVKKDGSMIKYLMLLSILSSTAIACDYLEAKWTCKGKAGDDQIIEITRNDHFALKQTKMGIEMGPFILDGTERSSIDSRNIQMIYTGNCTSEESLSVSVDQIYFGGLKVNFVNNINLVSKFEMNLETINNPPNGRRTVNNFHCTRPDSY
jgi:hypothetical protein